MRLLFDNNISYRIIKKIRQELPNALHVSSLPLPQPASDLDIWNYAKMNDYTIVSFDSDFHDLELIYGFPPKVIHLRFGNSTTENIAQTFLSKTTEIQQFIAADDVGILEIW